MRQLPVTYACYCLSKYRIIQTNPVSGKIRDVFIRLINSFMSYRWVGTLRIPHKHTGSAKLAVMW